MMEFENLQIEVPMGDASSQYLGIKVYEKKYHNKSKDFVIGFDPNSKEYIERKKRRAKRFGELKEKEVITAEKEKENVSNLDKFITINLKALTWPPVPDELSEEIRQDALLVYGVDHMSTKDVFEYFKLFGPETIEWIDDYSCNVVWDDRTSVNNALDNLSKTFGKLLELQRTSVPPTNQTDLLNLPVNPVVIKEEEEEESTDNAVMIEDEEEIDPKDVWRVGLPFREHQLFIRYATIKDRKMPGAAKRSEYYLRYGKNPDNSDKVPGVLSNSRKRKLQQMQKLATERFKDKEPDVKIVELAELKAEGIVSKMEVDEEEPIVKRLNVNDSDSSDETTTGMTMVADRVEVQQRLGGRFTGPTVHDRLGTPLSDDTDNEITGRVYRHQEEYATVGITTRKNNHRTDARDEIRNSPSRPRYNHQNYASCDGYVDEYGDYHDIYRADDLKNETEDKKDVRHELRKEDGDRNHKHQHVSPEKSANRNQGDVRNRLGSSRVESGAPQSDLRNKLRRKGKGDAAAPEENIKDEIEGEKLNLCIEIKREPTEELPMEEDEEEFEF